MSLAKRLDTMVVRVTSPDNMIMAKVEDRDKVTLAFRGNAYERYDRTRMEHQLSRLATLAWIGYQRGYYQALTDETGRPQSPSTDGWDLDRQRFRKEWSETTYQGISGNRLIRCTSVGMMNWVVDLKPDALDRLSEEQFRFEASSAADALIRDYKLKLIVLKEEHFGLNIPSWMKMPKGALRTLEK